MKKILVHAAMASLLLAPTAFADNHYGSSCKSASCSCQHESNAELKKLFEQVDLSFAQKREIRKTKMQYKQQLETIATNMQKNMMALQNYAHGNYNKEAIEKLAKKQGDLLEERIETNMQLRNALFNVLTSEQKAKFKSMLGDK